MHDKNPPLNLNFCSKTFCALELRVKAKIVKRRPKVKATVNLTSASKCQKSWKELSNVRLPMSVRSVARSQLSHVVKKVRACGSFSFKASDLRKAFWAFMSFLFFLKSESWEKWSFEISWRLDVFFLLVKKILKCSSFQLNLTNMANDTVSCLLKKITFKQQIVVYFDENRMRKIPLWQDETRKKIGHEDSDVLQMPHV